MSSSRGTSSTSTKTNQHDGRVAADGGAIGISSKGSANVNIVADEAFELGETAINGVINAAAGIVDAANSQTEIVASSLNQALQSTQQAAKSEAGQIGEQFIKVAIPAAALAFVAAAVMK